MTLKYFFTDDPAKSAEDLYRQAQELEGDGRQSGFAGIVRNLREIAGILRQEGAARIVENRGGRFILRVKTPVASNPYERWNRK